MNLSGSFAGNAWHPSAARGIDSAAAPAMIGRGLALCHPITADLAGCWPVFSTPKRPRFESPIPDRGRNAVTRRPQKHSLTLLGHRTSVSLEPEFWDAFRAQARAEGRGLNELAAEIDARRGDQGLASAIRVYVLRALQQRG